MEKIHCTKVTRREWTGVLKFDGAHSGGKSASLFHIRPLCAAIDVAHHIGVATASGINQQQRLVGRNVVEHAIGKNDAAETAQREQHLLHTPVGNFLRRLVQVAFASQHFSLVFVHLQHINVFACLDFLIPIHRIDINAPHITQKALCINHKRAFGVEVFDHVKRNVVGEQRAKHNVARFHIAQLLHGERIGFRPHALFALVLVLSVDVFEIHGVAARNHVNINAHATHGAHGVHFALGKRGYEFVGEVSVATARRFGLEKRVDTV